MYITTVSNIKYINLIERNLTMKNINSKYRTIFKSFGFKPENKCKHLDRQISFGDIICMCTGEIIQHHKTTTSIFNNLFKAECCIEVNLIDKTAMINWQRWECNATYLNKQMCHSILKEVIHKTKHEIKTFKKKNLIVSSYL